MPGLDTSVLVRWLVDDDRPQVSAVQQLFESAASTGAPLFVPDTVSLELEWVLRSRYGFDKAAILRTYTALLETRELEFQTEAALEAALHLYRQGSADFAECFHAGQCAAAARLPLLTFDARAARLPGLELLSG